MDHATLPGPPGFLSSTWYTLNSLPKTQDDVAVWPYSVDILLVISSFLASLHWPQGTPDLGKFGISYFELLLMFEVYTGQRLHTEKAFRPHLRPRRPCFFGFFSWYRARNPTWFSQVVFLGLFLVNLALTTLDCLIWVGSGMEMVSLLVLARVVTISFLLPFSISLVIRMELLQSFIMAP